MDSYWDKTNDSETSEDDKLLEGGEADYTDLIE
jgi:hypothetical protein